MGIGINTAVFCLVVIFVISHICDAQKCTKIPLKQVPGGNNVCEYTENQRTGPIEVRIGAEFVTINCQICTCSKTGLECCEGQKPPTEIPVGCKVIKEKCEYLVVKKKNPSKDCYTGASIYSQHDFGGTVQKFINSPEGTALIGLVKKGMSYFQRKINTPRWMSGGRRGSSRRNSESFTEPTEMDADMMMNMVLMDQMTGGSGQMGAASSLGLTPHSPFTTGRSLLSEGIGILGSIFNKAINGGNTPIDILSSGNTPIDILSFGNTGNGNSVTKSQMTDVVSATTGPSDFIPTTTPSPLLDFSGTGTGTGLGLFSSPLDFTGNGLTASNPNTIGYMSPEPHLWFK